MKKIKINYRNIFILVATIVLVVSFVLTRKEETPKDNVDKPDLSKNEMYLISSDYQVKLFTDQELTSEGISLVRGTEVDVKNEKDTYIKIEYHDETYYVNKSSLSKNYNDVVAEKEVFVQYFTNLYQDNYQIASFLEEGTKLEVTSFELNEDGSVSKYFVNHDDKTGFVLPFYLTIDEAEVNNRVILDHVADKYMDFNAKPRVKPNYESNPYKTDARGMYLSYYALTHPSFDVEAEIDIFVTNAPINTVVLDIKHDQGMVLFKSDTVAEYQTGADKDALTKEEMQDLIKTLKEHNVYVIGRIVTFRDNYFAKQYPESAITLKGTDEFYTYDDATFISAYDRSIWEYNLGLAEEAADFGFNEIQFDYVRFSENYTTDKHDLNKPIADETKTQAIQRYLEYAKDRISDKEVYLAADIYGLASYIDHDSVRIGQFFEAISTTVDVICPMAYPSHYDAYFSQSDPEVRIGWPNTYEEYELLIKYYTKDLIIRNEKLENPAYLRVWIEGYASTISTGAKMPAQVAGLKYNKVDSYLYWGNGHTYNSEGMRKAEEQ